MIFDQSLEGTRIIKWLQRYGLFLIYGLLIVGCGSAQQIADLQKERDSLREQLTEANSQIVILREKNASLEADLRGGRTAEEESKALDVREAGLNQLAQELLVRKNDLDEREAELRLREVDIEQKLDTARKEALNLANRWLIAFVALAVCIPLILIGVFMWMRSRSLTNQNPIPVQSLTPQQAYMLESVYNSLEVTNSKKQISIDRDNQG